MKKKLYFFALFGAALLLQSCGAKNGDATSVRAASDNTTDPVVNLQTAAPRLSVQLWSVKEDLALNFEPTLAAIADMGFDGVEFAGEFGPYEDDPKGLKQLLKGLGLQPSGAHVSFEQLNESNFDKTLNFYMELGVTTLIIGWEERAWHPEKVSEVVEELNALSEKLAPHGVLMGYHNHDKEFDEYQGATYWDYIARNTHQEVVMQLDVGWVVYVGKDPVDYVKAYPGKTRTTHYKVVPSEPEGGSPIIGEDDLDWLALSKVNVAYGGIEWFVVEQEDYPEGMTPIDAVRASKEGLAAALKEL